MSQPIAIGENNYNFFIYFKFYFHLYYLFTDKTTK